MCGPFDTFPQQTLQFVGELLQPAFVRVEPLRSSAVRCCLHWKLRLRTSQGKLKVEHSIIPGVRDLLERLLAANPQVRSVIPGVIRPVRDARGRAQVRVTVPTTNGWKAIALSGGARQELFISTTLGKEQLEAALTAAGDQ